MNKQTDNNKIKLAVIVVFFAGLGVHFGQPLIHGNKDTINLIVTVFSILAGFLVAVITLVGDPKSLPSGSWQVARLGSELTYNRLTRHKWLFKLYVVKLVAVFVSILIKKKFPAAATHGMVMSQAILAN